MAVILSNSLVSAGIFKMTVAFTGDVKPGQFFMLRAWDKDPLLSRPISVHNYEAGQLTFLYQVVGKGTEILARLQVDDEVTIQGPYGNGFPEITGDLCVVGGGIGTAPLYYLLRHYRDQNPTGKCRVYLGFRDIAYGVEAFAALADEVVLDVGGIITDKLSVIPSETVVTCGPEIMMAAVASAVPTENTVYVSLEAHMACGIGACLGCTCETRSGNKKVCKDGPVFLREEVFNV
ncbi:dihydroorotate dehydrogenase electron transfer subunit [Acetobacterium wieringae]|uniref:dihydroorotate dehydrogenase electron transfer subunit n=1 Tax=Acetobacterium wieringae TaxID=52694 RepID=UPI002034843C|nr:dihydroorotate dehydrogenase electron transfer subunit [Acetobacterium wieringae]URN85742.1 dihydroorotate dehydrogenase electron transfer subunit [Acetobacterium wieringae]